LEKEDMIGTTQRLADLLMSEDRARWILAQLHGTLDPIGEREAALLLRGAVVDAELTQLQRLEHDAPPQMFTERFTCVHEATSYVRNLIGRINVLLVRERARGRLVPQYALYRLALENAEWAFSIIGADPDLRTFLCGGAHARSPRIRTACHVVGVLLGVRDPVDGNVAPSCSDGLATMVEL
jgi:hypothetical protein